MELEKISDLYDVLDVDFSSNEEEINNQYKKKIKKFKKILSSNQKLTKNDKETIKTLKIAQYVLSDDYLREKYNLLKILEESDDSKNKNFDNHEIEYDDNIPSYQYKEIQNEDIPLRKDKRLDYDQLSSRQFERFEQKTFDLSKDRQLRGVKLEQKKKN